MTENVFDDQALQNYLNEISIYPTLTREEEQSLAQEAKNSNQEAKNQLIKANLKFVVKIASHYQNRGLSLSELISEGNMGLIKAIEKFDPSMDIKLISYAVWWIKQRILFAISEKSSMIRIPMGRANAANKIKHAKDRILAESGNHASMDDIMEKTDLSSKLIDDIFYQPSDTISIDEISFNSKNDDINILDFIEDPSIEDPKTIYYRERLQDTIKKSIDTLSNRDALIIKAYFGLDGGKEKNFAQIANELGLSRERVRQIQKSALQKILKDSYFEMEKDIDYIIKNNL